MDKKKRQQSESQLANLKKFHDNYARECQKKAVAKRIENNKEKKRLKDAITVLLDMYIDDETALKGSELLAMAMFQKALAGDVQAFNSLRDTSGEVIKQQQEINIERPSINIGVARTGPDKITQNATKLIDAKPDESKGTDQTDDVT